MVSFSFWENLLFDDYKVYVAEYVSNNDSSCRRILTHSFSNLIAAGKLTYVEWPRYKNGRKKPNNGLLSAWSTLKSFSFPTKDTG
jgi:hypothetical protein